LERSHILPLIFIEQSANAKKYLELFFAKKYRSGFFIVRELFSVLVPSRVTRMGEFSPIG
jgi:hypothetical protein